MEIKAEEEIDSNASRTESKSEKSAEALAHIKMSQTGVLYEAKIAARKLYLARREVAQQQQRLNELLSGEDGARVSAFLEVENKHLATEPNLALAIRYINQIHAEKLVRKLASEFLGV